MTFEQYQEVQTILKQLLPHVTVRAFGSRVEGRCKPLSDLDLCLQAEQAIPLETLACLEEAFSLSALPFKVDVIDWHKISPEFQQQILSKQIVIDTHAQP